MKLEFVRTNLWPITLPLEPQADPSRTPMRHCERLKDPVDVTNGTYFWVARFAIMLFTSARGRVSQP